MPVKVCPDEMELMDSVKHLNWIDGLSIVGHPPWNCGWASIHPHWWVRVWMEQKPQKGRFFFFSLFDCLSWDISLFLPLDWSFASLVLRPLDADWITPPDFLGQLVDSRLWDFLAAVIVSHNNLHNKSHLYLRLYLYLYLYTIGSVSLENPN